MYNQSTSLRPKFLPFPDIDTTILLKSGLQGQVVKQEPPLGLCHFSQNWVLVVCTLKYILNQF